MCLGLKAFNAARLSLWRTNDVYREKGLLLNAFTVLKGSVFLYFTYCARIFYAIPPAKHYFVIHYLVQGPSGGVEPSPTPLTLRMLMKGKLYLIPRSNVGRLLNPIVSF